MPKHGMLRTSARGVRSLTPSRSTSPRIWCPAAFMVHGHRKVRPFSACPRNRRRGQLSNLSAKNNLYEPSIKSPGGASQTLSGVIFFVWRGEGGILLVLPVSLLVLVAPTGKRVGVELSHGVARQESTSRTRNTALVFVESRRA